RGGGRGERSVRLGAAPQLQCRPLRRRRAEPFAQRVASTFEAQLVIPGFGGAPYAHWLHRWQLAPVVPAAVAQFGVVRGIHSGAAALDPRFAEQQRSEEHTSELQSRE